MLLLTKEVQTHKKNTSVSYYTGMIFQSKNNINSFRKQKYNNNQFSYYQKLFGLDIEDSDHKNAINFLFYVWNFTFIDAISKACPSFQVYKNFVKIKFNTEYRIVENKGQLSKHFKKSTFHILIC